LVLIEIESEPKLWFDAFSQREPVFTSLENVIAPSPNALPAPRSHRPLAQLPHSTGIDPALSIQPCRSSLADPALGVVKSHSTSAEDGLRAAPHDANAKKNPRQFPAGGSFRE
jgi:hypothetical protein